MKTLLTWNKYVFIHLISLLAFVTAPAFAGRTNPMFDVSQTARPEWGSSWCAPTAVGNSFAWLAKEYKLDGLMKVNGTGDPLSAEDVINILGKVDMNTDPAWGTDRSKIEQAKKDYIKRHGLEGKIKVESQVAIPKAYADGSYAGLNGTKVTQAWLKEQYDKGQDVEFSVSYYEKRADGKWYRTGGHAAVYDGDISIPGIAVGGHMLSLADIYDLSPADNSFQISFTDPGRDDLTGEYGAIAYQQYDLTDYSGAIWHNTASTYNVVYEADPFGLGAGYDALILDGYMGAGSFASDGAAREFLTVLEAGWAESPIPAPGALLLGSLGMFLIGHLRNRNIFK